MEFIFSNHPPLKTKTNSFYDAFYSLLPETTELDIAVGYITADSLLELQKIVELNHINNLNLTIGMHYLDKFTQSEYNAACDLNSYLTGEERGGVQLVTPFRFHGKLYSYSKNGIPFAGIIGSNNLSGIIENNSRIYEASLLLREPKALEDLRDFIYKLNRSSTKNIADLDIDEFKASKSVLENNNNVEAVNTSDVAACVANLSDVAFEIPIKGAEVAPYSNLNAYFGKGRKDQRGLVKPRHWYEAEIIVPKSITSLPNYPQSGTGEEEFTVITDDGWKFACKISGDSSKNFRSKDDLKILGKWLKGRLEKVGALDVGKPVTSDTLKKYGRDTFTMTKLNKPNLWYLNFGVNK